MPLNPAGRLGMGRTPAAAGRELIPGPRGGAGAGSLVDDGVKRAAARSGSDRPPPYLADCTASYRRNSCELPHYGGRRTRGIM